MKPALRQFLLSLHLWLGFGLGGLLVVTGGTGAILAWRAPLDRHFHRALYVVAPGATRLGYDELAVRARAAHPGAALEHVRAYAAPEAPVVFGFSDQVLVHLNPYNGDVLGRRARYGDVLGWIEGLHKFLQLKPAVGEKITGGAAALCLVVIVSGIVLWWPKTRRALRAGVTLNWSLRGRPWNLGLHKTAGFYAALVLFVSAATGVPIAFNLVSQPSIGGQMKAPSSSRRATETFVGFDAAARSLLTVLPGAQEFYVSVPKRGEWRGYGISAAASHPNARSNIWFDPADGAVLKAVPYAQAAAGFRAYYWMMSLHTGQLGGPVVSVLLTLGALALPLLVVTGILSYVQRKLRRGVAASI